MPLAFQSLNRGRAAFGFFNIETDMLLLDNHFMFADTSAGWSQKWPVARHLMTIESDSRLMSSTSQKMSVT